MSKGSLSAMRIFIPTLLLATVTTIFVFHAFSVNRFVPSDVKNIFNIRGEINGATASLVNLPDGEQVITTQAHVVDAFAKYPTLKLTWRKFYGWDFKEWSHKDGAFDFAFKPEVLWKDDEMDIAFLSVPAGLKEACDCKGLETTSYHQGMAAMIGYPQTGMRTYPLTGKTWKHLGTWLGTVEQRKSSGKTWIEGADYLADTDGVPGNSGSSILDENGKVIGMLHLLKSWYGEGYKQKSPAITLLPIELILQKYQEHKR